MTLTNLIREAITAARASRIPTLLVTLVVAAMCFAAVATVGRQAAVEAAVADELAGAESRLLTVTETNSSGVLNVPTVALLARLSSTQAVVARDLPIDAINGALGPGSTRVAVTGLHGTIDAALQLTGGRFPGPAEVIIPEAMLTTLGLEAPVGYLEATDGTQWAIVGSFIPLAPFSDLGSMAVTLPGDSPRGLAGAASYQQVRIVAATVADVTAVHRATLAVIAADPTEIQVSSALAAAATSQSVAGQLAGFGRALLLLILGVGAFFVAVVVLADVLIRRRDLGRRRTLGITRGDLIALVALRTSLPALVGALLGAAGGYLLVTRDAGAVPLDFTLAVAVLGSLTAALACLPPAAFASRRDPVEVMRTP